MQVIPTKAVPSQILAVVLAGQICRVKVYQKSTGLFLDLYINDVLTIGGVLALDAVRMVRDPYFGFVGDLAFFDTEGSDAPVYSGLDGRWFLAYLEATDL